jgi:hypothetical protein
MTTTVIPEQPTVPAGDPLRPVTIGANLLPREIVDGRRARSVRRMALSVLALVLVGMGGFYALTLLQTGAASTDLTRAEDEALTLTRQQKSFAGVVSTQRDSKLIEQQLATLIADDVRWSTLLASLRAAAPDGVKIGNVAASLDAERTGGQSARAETRLPSTSDSAVIGGVDISGVGKTKPQIAAYVDALAKVDGVADPYLGTATKTGSGFVYSIHLDITEAAIDGRYTTPTGGR